MSYVSKIDTIIDDADVLKAAALRLGMEVREKTSYKWYGYSVGDYPLPIGFAVQDLGKCEFALGVTGNEVAYEVGVVKNPLGPGYVLLHDFWQGGFGLLDVIGQGAENLLQEYDYLKTIESLRLEGYYIDEERQQNGAYIITASIM